VEQPTIITLDVDVQTDFPMPELTRPRTPSISDASSVGPITPPTTLKRTLSTAFDDAAGPSTIAKGPANMPADIEARPTKRLRSIGKTVGLLAIGAVVGSMGTIAGLMQLAD
jgi:hypothetical protein